jgi:hypothetical protein
MKKMTSKAVGTMIIAGSLAGCVGSNAVTEKLMMFNVQVVDNRYARAGVNLLLSPVYGITVAVDYVVFNSIEFWTGKNPLNGKPHIFDMDVETMMNINDDVGPGLSDAPLDPISSNRMIEEGTMKKIDDNTFMMDIVYNDGVEAQLMGVRDGEKVSYYMDGVLVAQTTLSELQALSENRI